MAEVRMEWGQEFDATITGVKDSQGRDTTFDGVPTWETSDSNVVDLRVSEDGLSAIVGSFEQDGAATVTVTGDARMGPDVVPVIGVLSVIVAPGEAVIFDFQAGALRPRATEPAEPPVEEPTEPTEPTEPPVEEPTDPANPENPTDPTV